MSEAFGLTPARSDGRKAMLSPMQWGESLSGAPVSSGRLEASTPILVRRWQGVCPDIEQPPLDHHYITLHLGGPKRIRRRGEGRDLQGEIAEGAYSVTPAGSAFGWRTEGPVDFAHIYLRPSVVDEVILSEFDRDARRVDLADALGARDPLLEALLATVTESLTAEKRPSRAYWDSLSLTLICRVLNRHSGVAGTAATAPYMLAPARVNRVIDFVNENLAADIGLSELAAVSGLSPYHFSRGFHRATGYSPCAYLTRRRVEGAKSLLDDHRLSIAEIARRCGFSCPSRLSTVFKRATGVSPSQYRLRH